MSEHRWYVRQHEDYYACADCSIRISGLDLVDFKLAWTEDFGEQVSVEEAADALAGPCSQGAPAWPGPQTARWKERL